MDFWTIIVTLCQFLIEFIKYYLSKQIRKNIYEMQNS